MTNSTKDTSLTTQVMSDDSSSDQQSLPRKSLSTNPLVSPLNTSILDTSVSASASKRVPRLMIMKIVMENFKSYGGRREIGPFHKCFSSVIGPNGSGKSNVIDAMLFVFGERASKIRLKKLSELIHSSSTFPNFDKCAVAVYFADIIDHPNSRDGYEVVEGSEFIITRTANRQNISKYYIDDHESTFGEVSKRLRSKGIDLDNNRFLILQGEVEQIAMMKPKGATPHEVGMLEYLEDIIGSSVYVDQIDIAGKEYDRLVEERSAWQSRNIPIEHECELLRVERNKALALLDNEWKLFSLDAQLLQLREYQTNIAIESLNTSKDKLEEQRQKHKESTAAVVEEAKAIETQFKTKQEEYIEMKKINQEASEKFTRCDTAYNSIQSQMRLRAEQRIAEKDKREKYENDIQKLQKQYEIQQETRPKLVDAITELEAQKAATEQEHLQLCEVVQQQTESYRRELDQVHQQLQPLDKKESELSIEIGKLATEKQELRGIGSDLDIKKQELHTRIEKTNTLVSRSRILIDEKKAEHARARARFSEIESILQQSSQKHAQLREERTILSSDYERTREELQSRESRGKLVNALLAEKRKNPKFKGVYGMLGDLGCIDSTYDVAISTACPSLRNILVDTTATAQACVELLRAKQLGRVTFIVLDKQTQLKQQMFQRQKHIPEGTKRLFDLVKPANEEFLPAFYFALRDTLVTDTIENAKKVAFGTNQNRWRTVSLGGEIVELSGAMSGGGSRPIRGLMKDRLYETGSGEGRRRGRGSDMNDGDRDNADINANEEEEDLGEKLKRLEHRLHESEGNLRRFVDDMENKQSEKNSLENTSSTISREISRLETICNDYDGMKSRLQEQESALLREIMESEKDNERIEKESIQIDIKIGALQKELQALTQEITVYREKEAEIRQKMMKESGPEVIAVSTKITQLTSAIRGKNKDISKIDLFINTFERKKGEIETNITNSTSEITRLEAQLTELKTAREKCEEEAKLIVEERTRADENVKRLEGELGELENQLTNYTDKLRVLARQEASIVKEIDVLNEKLQQTTEAVQIIGKKIDIIVRDMQRTYTTLESALAPISLSTILCKSAEMQAEETARHQEKVWNSRLEQLQQRENEGTISSSDAAATRRKIDEDRGNEKRRAAADLEEALADARTTKEDISEDTITLDSYVYKSLQPDELQQLSRERLQLEYDRCKSEGDKLSGNVESIDKYNLKREEMFVTNARLDAATKRRDAAKAIYDALRKKRLFRFTSGFGIIAGKLKEMYQMLTRGGDAELEVKDTNDPFVEGIIFTVRPPKKSWKQISNLSGGEKTLSSLALVFALHHYKPTPLYVMDEIDAALDYTNVSIVANYIKNRTDNAQFIVISLRNNMFELADRLVGIYKTFNVTKSIAIDPRAFEKKAIEVTKEEIELHKEKDKIGDDGVGVGVGVGINREISISTTSPPTAGSQLQFDTQTQWNIDSQM